MKKGLSAETFAKLLDRLSDDHEDAGEGYEDLRRVLLRYFEWRGASHADELADETLNRVAGKLGDGVEIQNVRGYCHEVARLVFMESTRARDLKNIPLDAVDFEIGVESDADAAAEKEARMRCLDGCLETLKPESRELITQYYRDDGQSRIEHRQKLALRLGLRRDALANRAQRLRDRLESCVKNCIGKIH